MESAACVENIEAVGFAFRRIYQSINNHATAVRDGIRRVYSVVKERKAGEGTRPSASFDSLIIAGPKSQEQENFNGNVTTVFPRMGTVATELPKENTEFRAHGANWRNEARSA